MNYLITVVKLTIFKNNVNLQPKNQEDRSQIVPSAAFYDAPRGIQLKTNCTCAQISNSNINLLFQSV